ncbi:hypothetical protein [Planktomarina temperata]
MDASKLLQTSQLSEAEHSAQWIWTYNNDWPKIAIGGITPTMKLKMAA